MLKRLRDDRALHIKVEERERSEHLCGGRVEGHSAPHRVPEQAGAKTGLAYRRRRAGRRACPLHPCRTSTRRWQRPFCRPRTGRSQLVLTKVIVVGCGVRQQHKVAIRSGKRPGQLHRREPLA